MEILDKNTILRLAKNVQKIPNDDFDIIQKYNSGNSWNDLDTLECLIYDYIVNDLKIYHGSMVDYIYNQIVKDSEELTKAEILEIAEMYAEEYREENEDIDEFVYYKDYRNPTSEMITILKDGYEFIF